jgi:uncharacterized membrane protein YqjE
MAKQPPFPATSATESSRVDREPDSAAGLLSRLMGEVSTLFRKEIALAKAEVSEAASEAKAGAISLVAGGAILFAAVLVLLAAIVLLLAERMDPWLAALIVAVVVAVIGFVMIQSGKKKLDPSSFKPERTQDALRKDKEMVQRRAS